MSELGGDRSPAHRRPPTVTSVVTDHHGRIRSSDGLFAHYYGLECRDVVGTLLEEYVCSVDRPYLRSLLTVPKDERIEGVVRFCLFGQGFVPARVVIEPGPERSTFAVAIIGQDLSCRELDGGDPNGLLLARAVLNQTQDLILVLDPDGHVLLRSLSMTEFLGRDPVGFGFFKVLPLEPDPDLKVEGTDPPPPRGSTPAAGTGSTPASGRYRFPARNNRRIQVVVDQVISSDDAREAKIGSVVRLDDITERLAGESRMGGGQEDLSTSSREIQQFVHAASHDLQEPLRMVSGYLQLLERRYAGRLDKEGLEFLGFAVEGAKRMQELIDALLVYSRVVSRARPPGQVDARVVIAEALEHLEQKLAFTHAEITVGPTPTVWADRAQLVQVFEQLIDNALTYCSDAVPRVLIDAERVNGSTRFRVQDNGIGIDPQFHERVFELFSRLNAREQYPGIGIGLAVVQRIIERHGGRCWVESSEGSGSTFFFTLPDHPMGEGA